MIIELLVSPIFALIKGLISLIPQSYDLPNYITDVFSLLVKASEFFPMDMFVLCIGNIGFWLAVHFVWAIVEWVYKKIPGVD